MAKLASPGPTFLIESYSAAAAGDAAAQGDRLRLACAELRAGGCDVDYVGSLAVPQDELVLHVLLAADVAAVRAAARGSAVRVERIVESLVIGRRLLGAVITRSSPTRTGSATTRAPDRSPGNRR